MKLLLPIFILSFCLSASAQQTDLKLLIKDLKSKIKQSEKGEKLKWMDSLCNVMKNRPDVDYDSILQQTIDYAFDLDSLEIATRQTARLIWYYCNRVGKPEKGKSIFETFISEKRPIKNNLLLSRLYINGGDTYYFTGKIEKSIELYEVAGSYALKSKDSILFSISKKYIADAYSQLGEFSKASQLLLEVEHIYKKLNDTIRLINTMSSRANLYSQNGFYKEASKEREVLISLSKKIKYYPGLLTALYNSSIDYGTLGNHKERIRILNEALGYARKSEMKDQYEPQLLNGLVISYSQINQLKNAEKILQEIQANPERYTTGRFYDKHKKALAYFHFANGDYKQALDYGQTFLELKKSKQRFVDQEEAHLLISKIYETLGNGNEALKHLKAFTKIKDSIENVQKTKALAYYQTLYETEKRDAKIEAQTSEINLLDTQNKIKTQWLLFGGLGLLSVFALIYLIRSRNFARKKQKLQAEFSRNLIKGQEEERTRVARELHDSVGQKLMLLNKKTKSIGNTDIESLADNTLEELRSISRGLHPANIERLGISAAIESLVNEVDANTDIFFTCDIENVDSKLNKETSIHLYRIIQESLTNMVKHSDAKAASISIEQNENIVKAVIKDNGKGFEFTDKLKKNTSLGMKTLMERAKIIRSKFHIESIPNKGTTVQLTIPARI